jgi:hypothetical protein
MRHRFLASLGALAVVIAIVSLTPVPVVGQAPSGAATKAKTWTPPRTPDGHPDLQGVWNNASTTPLERPSKFAGKQILTAEEVAEQDAQDDVLGADRPPRAGDTGFYNAFWLERGKATTRTSLIVDPPDGRVPYTPEGRKRADAFVATSSGSTADSWEDRNLYERCLTRGLPGAMMPGFYNHNYQILQTPGYVAILVEMIHDARIIPMDGRPHLPQNIRQWLGDSRGRWEGNTLVVETMNFTDQTAFRGASENMHLVERFTRVDADTLVYEFTVTDPASFARPWTAQIPMIRSAEKIYEYACHEGNYGMFNLLSGARALEKARLH